MNFTRPIDWLRRWRRSMEITVVATATFTTKIIGDDGNYTGESVAHCASFQIDGNGKRSSSVSTSIDNIMQCHNGLRITRIEWEHHGHLPTFAKRVGITGRQKLTIIDGGIK